MHALVTGGAGFIGSALVSRLVAEGHTIDVVDNLSTGSLFNLTEARASAGRDLTFHQLDVRGGDVAELIRRRRPEVVWHLAAHTDPDDASTNPSVDALVNVVGTLGVLEGVRAAGTRKVVFASDAAVYGEPAGRAPVGEFSRRQPLSIVGIGKHAVDTYLVAEASLYGTVFTSLVMGSVYGPAAGGGVVAAWASCLAGGRVCTVFGDGRQVRDFVFVDDVVDALVRAADGGDGRIINVGTGRATSLVDLHAVMVEVAGRLVAASLASGSSGSAGSAGSAGPSGPSGPSESLGSAEAAESALASGDDASSEESEVSEVSGWSGGSVGSGEVAAARGPVLGLRHVDARPFDATRLLLDPTRAAEELGWQPWTTLEEGIEQVLQATMGSPGR